MAKSSSEQLITPLRGGLELGAVAVRESGQHLCLAVEWEANLRVGDTFDMAGRSYQVVAIARVATAKIAVCEGIDLPEANT